MAASAIFFYRLKLVFSICYFFQRHRWLKVREVVFSPSDISEEHTWAVKLCKASSSFILFFCYFFPSTCTLTGTLEYFSTTLVAIDTTLLSIHSTRLFFFFLFSCSVRPSELLWGSFFEKSVKGTSCVFFFCHFIKRGEKVLVYIYLVRADPSPSWVKKMCVHHIIHVPLMMQGSTMYTQLGLVCPWWIACQRGVMRPSTGNHIACGIIYQCTEKGSYFVWRVICGLWIRGPLSHYNPDHFTIDVSKTCGRGTEAIL